MFYIFADGELLYSSIQPENRLILAPTCSLEVGMSGSLDFTILPGHALYDSLDKLTTQIVAYMDDEQIFSGRVLNWDIDFYKQKTVHCEGNLAYLLDTIQPPRSIETTVSTYFGYIVDEHNIQVGVGEFKRFVKGTVSIDQADTVALFENNGYRDTRSAIDSDLIGVYGGFLRARTVGAVTYLDYIKEYGTSSTQTLSFGSNILDMSETLSSEDIFTVLLPTGDIAESEVEGVPSWPLTIESVNDGSKLLEHLDGISKYGRIVHTQHFSGVTDAETLKAKAQEYFDRVYREPPSSFSIRALDLHFYNASLDQFLVGQNIAIVSAPHGMNRTLTCLSINYDIENVENTELTFGVLTSDIADPNSSFSSPSSGSTLSSQVGTAVAGPSGGSIGKMYKHITEGDDWIKIATKKIELIGEDILLKIDKGDGDEIIAGINLTSNLTKIWGKQIEMVGTNGWKVTVGSTVGRDLETILDEAYAVMGIDKDGSLFYELVHDDNVITSINASAEGVTINGPKITLTGAQGIIVEGNLAVIGDVSAVSADLEDLMSGEIQAGSLWAAAASFTSLEVSGYGVNAKTKAVGTSISVTNNYVGGVLQSVDVQLNTENIYYWGNTGW